MDEQQIPGHRLRRVAILAAISSLPVFALAGGMALQAQHRARDFAVAQAVTQIELMSALVSQTQVSSNTLGSGLGSLDREQLDDFAQAQISSGRLVRLRLYAPNHRIVYSSDGRTDPDDNAAGRSTSPLDITIAKALAGHSNAQVGRPEGSSSTTGRPSATGTQPVLAAAAAVRGRLTHARMGVLQAEFPYEPSSRTVLSTLLRWVSPVLLAGLVLIHFFLTSSTVRLSGPLLRATLRFRHQAHHDRLTDLPNRELLVDRIQRVGEEVGDTERAAVAVINLDRFQDINDAIGHRNGDLMLIGLAERLRSSVAAGDTVARLGSDAFALLLPTSGRRDTLKVALNRVRTAIEEEVTLDDLPLRVEASIGVALIPRDGVSPSDLLDHAETAMYLAKRTQSGIAWFDQSREHGTLDRLTLIGELRRAIERDELVLHYQPQVQQPSGQVHTLEALVRWQHPTRGLIGPDLFIPIAEQTNLIDDVTGWVLTHALIQLKQWRGSGRDLALAVNISARTLHNLTFPETVQDILYHTAATPDWLLLEITETALVTDAARAAIVLDQLHATGLRLSLDDFGQGYTSLSQLSTLPFTELKIDKSFVMNMRTKAGDAAIVRSVIDLAHNLSLNVVAEGVEDDETLSILVELGCDIAQGYHFSRPLPADSVETWLMAHDRTLSTGPTSPRTTVPAARSARVPVASRRVRSTDPTLDSGVHPFRPRQPPFDEV